MTDEMTPPAVPPPAGWYPDPEKPGILRWWDGHRWDTMRKREGQWSGGSAPFSPDSREPQPVGPAFGRLGRAVRIALRVLAVAVVAEVALYAWGLSMFADAAAVGDADRLATYDRVDAILAIVALLAMIVAGITWMVWQYKLAKAARPAEIRRGPGWHAWSWVIPVVGMWFPYQNVKDLWRRRFPDRGWGILKVWWAAFVVTTVVDRIYARAEPATIEDLENLVTLELLSAVITLVALVLAIRIHRALSDGETVVHHAAAAPIGPATPAG